MFQRQQFGIEKQHSISIHGAVSAKSKPGLEASTAASLFFYNL